MQVVEADRLTLRRLTVDDAAFIQELVNDPAWLKFIGDRGVRTLESARGFILDGPVAMYAHQGFGLYLVELKETCAPVGICGLVKRDWLTDVDLGFAFLPEFRGRGFASEAGLATLEYGRHSLGLDRIAAIVVPENQASIQVLRKLGFSFERMVLPPNGPREVCLYLSKPV